MQQNEYTQTKQITLDEIVRKIIDFKNILLQKKKFIFIFTLGCLLIGVLYVIFSKPIFIARSTFMVNDSERSGSEMFFRLAGQLGVPSSSSIVNSEKLVELLKTKRIIEDALLKKVEIDSSIDFLANHFINIFKLDENWDNHEILRPGFRFKTDNRKKFGLKEFHALLQLHKLVYKKIIAESSRNGIISLSFNSTNEDIAKCFTENLVQTLSDYYIAKTIEQQQKTYNILVLRMDSVKNELKNTEAELAKFKDETHQLVKVQGFLSEYRLKRDIEVLNAIYIEGIKNLELAKFTLLNKTPLIQIIDQPVFPLEAKKTSFLLTTIVCLFLGFFCSLTYVILQYFYIAWQQRKPQAQLV